jgi:hypothetical protein
MSAEIIHLELQARMAAHRARRGVVAAQSASPSASVVPFGRPQTPPTETAQ